CAEKQRMTRAVAITAGARRQRLQQRAHVVERNENANLGRRGAEIERVKLQDNARAIHADEPDQRDSESEVQRHEWPLVLARGVRIIGKRGARSWRVNPQVELDAAARHWQERHLNGGKWQVMSGQMRLPYLVRGIKIRQVRMILLDAHDIRERRACRAADFFGV